MIPRKKRPLRYEHLVESFKMMFMKFYQQKDCIERFEQEFARFFNIKHSVATSGAVDGLLLVLQALNIKKGDRVLVPAYGSRLFADIMIKYGLDVVPVDINPATLNIDVDDLERKINDSTKMIMVNHANGIPCEIEKIKEIKEQYSTFIVENCMDAFGSEVNNRFVGTWGDVAIISFWSVPVFFAYGAGLILTNNDQIAYRVIEKTSKREFFKCLELRQLIVTWAQEFLIRSPFYWLMLKLKKQKFIEALHTPFCSMRFRRNHLPTSLEGKIALKNLQKFNDVKVEISRNYEKIVSALPPVYQVQQIQNAQGSSPVISKVVMNLKAGEVHSIIQKCRDAGVDVCMENDDLMWWPQDTACSKAANILPRLISIPWHIGMKEKEIRKILSALAYAGKDLEV